MISGRVSTGVSCGGLGAGVKKKLKKGKIKKKKREYQIATGGHTGHGQGGWGQEHGVNCSIGGEREDGEGHCPVTCQ